MTKGKQEEGGGGGRVRWTAFSDSAALLPQPPGLRRVKMATCQVTPKTFSPLTAAVIFFSKPPSPLSACNNNNIIIIIAAAAIHVGLRRQIGGLFSPHVASLQRDLASVHMLTAGSLVEGMICQPLFMKGRQRQPVR